MKLKVAVTVAVVGLGLYGLSWCSWLLNQPDNLLVIAGVVVCLFGLMFGPGILIYIWRKRENKKAA